MNSDAVRPPPRYLVDEEWQQLYQSQDREGSVAGGGGDVSMGTFEDAGGVFLNHSSNGVPFSDVPDFDGASSFRGGGGGGDAPWQWTASDASEAPPAPLPNQTSASDFNILRDLPHLIQSGASTPFPRETDLGGSPNMPRRLVGPEESARRPQDAVGPGSWGGRETGTGGGDGRPTAAVQRQQWSANGGGDVNSRSLASSHASFSVSGRTPLPADTNQKSAAAEIETKTETARQAASLLQYPSPSGGGPSGEDPEFCSSSSSSQRNNGPVPPPTWIGDRGGGGGGSAPSHAGPTSMESIPKAPAGPPPHASHRHSPNPFPFPPQPQAGGGKAHQYPPQQHHQQQHQAGRGVSSSSPQSFSAEAGGPASGSGGGWGAGSGGGQPLLSFSPPQAPPGQPPSSNRPASSSFPQHYQQTGNSGGGHQHPSSSSSSHTPNGARPSPRLQHQQPPDHWGAAAGGGMGGGGNFQDNQQKSSHGPSAPGRDYDSRPNHVPPPFGLPPSQHTHPGASVDTPNTPQQQQWGGGVPLPPPMGRHGLHSPFPDGGVPSSVSMERDAHSHPGGAKASGGLRRRATSPPPAPSGGKHSTNPSHPYSSPNFQSQQQQQGARGQHPNMSMGTPPSHQPPPPPLPPPPGHPLAHKPSDPHQSPNNTVTAEPALYAQPRSITEGSSHQHPSPSAGPASGSLSTPGSSTTHGGGAPSLSSHGSSIGGPAHSTPHSSHSQNHTQPQQHSERKHPTHHPPPHGSHSQLPSSSGSITNTAATPSSVSTLVGSGNPTSPLHHPEHPIQVRVLQQSHGGSSDANAKPGAAGLSRSQTEKGPAQAKGGSRSPSEGGSSGKEQSAGGDTCTPTPPLPASQSAPPPPPPPGSSPPFPPLLNQGGGAGGGGGGNHSHSHHAMMMPNSHHHHQGYTWRRNAPPADRPLVSSAESGGAQSHAQQQQGQQPGQGHLSSAAPSSASSGKPGGVSKGSGGKKNLTLVPKHPEQQKQQQQTEHSSRGSGGASAKSGLPGPPPPSREAADPHHQHAGVKVLTGPDRMVRGVEEQKKNDLLLSHTHVEDQKGGGMSSSSSSASAGSSKSNATAVHHPTMPQHAHPTRPPPHPKTAAAPFPRSSPAVEDASLQQPALQPPPQPPPGPVPLGDAAASPTILGSSHPSASASALRSASPLRSPNSRLLAEPDSQQPPESQQKGTEKETPGASQPASLSLEHQHANSSSSSRGTPPIPPHAATAQSQKTGGPKQPQQQGVASKQAGVESGGSALVSTHQQNPNPKAAGVLTVNQTRDGVRVLAAPSGPRLVPKAAPGVPPLVVPQQQQQSVPAQAPSPLKSPPAASLGTSTVLLQHQQKCCTKCGTAYPEHVQNALTVFAANAERRRQQEDEPAVFSYRSPSPSVTPSVMNVEVEPSEYSIGRTRREREKLGGKLGPGKRKKRAAPIPSLPSGGTLKKREEEKDPDCPIAALCNSASARSLLSSCAASCGTTCKPPLLDRLTKTENHSDAESKSSARDRKPLPTAISIRSMKAKEVEIPSGEAAKESASSGFSLNFLKMHQEDPSAEYFDVTKNSMAAPLQRRTLKKEKGKEEGGKSVSSVQGEKGGSQPSTSADQEAVVQGSETAAGKVMGGQTGAEALEGPALGEKTKDPPGGEVRQHKPEAPSGSPKKKVEGRAVRRKLVERLGPRQVLLLSGGGAVGVIGAFVLVQGLQGVVTLSSRLFRGWGR